MEQGLVKTALLTQNESLVLSGKLEVDLRKIAKLSQTPQFEIYMGYPADDIDSQLELARKQRVNVVLLDTPEEWGYSFLLVETKKLHLKKSDCLGKSVDVRINPLEPVVLGKGRDEDDSEFTISPWDINPDAVGLSDFGYWNKITELQWPTEVRLQVSLLSSPK